MSQRPSEANGTVSSGEGGDGGEPTSSSKRARLSSSNDNQKRYIDGDQLRDHILDGSCPISTSFTENWLHKNPHWDGGLVNVGNEWFSPLHMLVWRHFRCPSDFVVPYGKKLAVLTALLGHPGIRLDFKCCYNSYVKQTPLELALSLNVDVESLFCFVLSVASNPVPHDELGRNRFITLEKAFSNLPENKWTNVLHFLLKFESIKATINEQDEHGLTALLYAARSYPGQKLGLLLEAGADPNIIPHDGESSSFLHCVLSSGNAAKVIHSQVFPEKKNPYNVGKTVIDARDREGRTPLARVCEACLREDDCNDALESLLVHGADTTLADSRGFTPLHHLARFSLIRRPWLTEKLASSLSVFLNSFPSDVLGKVVNCKDSQDKNPLHWAALRNNLGAVQKLLAAQAHATARDEFGHTPLHLWVRLDRWDSRIYDAPPPTFLSACPEEFKESLVNVKDNLGWTPLHWASAKGNFVAMQELLVAGADATASDVFGRTPLHYVGLVVSTDSDGDIYQENPISTGVRYWLSKKQESPQAEPYVLRGRFLRFNRGRHVVDLLISQHGADPLALDNDGNLPFFFAATYKPPLDDDWSAHTGGQMDVVFTMIKEAVSRRGSLRFG